MVRDHSEQAVCKADSNLAILEKTQPDLNGKAFDAFSKMLNPTFYFYLTAVQ